MSLLEGVNSRLSIAEDWKFSHVLRRRDPSYFIYLCCFRFREMRGQVFDWSTTGFRINSWLYLPGAQDIAHSFNSVFTGALEVVTFYARAFDPAIYYFVIFILFFRSQPFRLSAPLESFHDLHMNIEKHLIPSQVGVQFLLLVPIHNWPHWFN